MATNQNETPSFFNFLKEGVLLPSRNRRLSTALLVLGNDLTVQRIHDQIQLDVKALSTTEPGSVQFAELLQEIQNDTKKLLLVAMGSILIAVVVGSAVRIVVLFAAVSTYSSDGEQRATTFGALLGKAKAQIKGPLLTLAFVLVVEIVCVVPLVAMVALVGFLVAKQYLVALLVVSLLVIAASVCLVYFSFICSFSVVVAVAEPDCHGAAALGKAWRLASGKKWQIVLYVAITGALAAAVLPVHTLARTCAGNSVAPGLLLGLVYVVMLALVELFAVCAMTAFYYERRESIDSQLGATTVYAKVATEEANA